MIGVVLIIVLVIILICYSKKENCKEGIKTILEGINNTDHFKESDLKTVVDSGWSKIKNKMKSDMKRDFSDVIDVMGKRFNMDYDYITHQFLESKKKELERIYGSKSLIKNIKKRKHDEDALERALKMEGCKYDKEMEALNSLVFIDENPILYIPFYNESIFRDLVLEKMCDIYDDELSGSTDSAEIRVKNKIITKTKKEFEDIIDKDLLKSIIRDNMDF